MRWKAPRSQPGMVAMGEGPADTATVVIGIDGLPESWDAFCWACREARRLGGRVVAVFIGQSTLTCSWSVDPRQTGTVSPAPSGSASPSGAGSR